MTTDDLIFEGHTDGIKPEAYDKHPELQTAFRVTATGECRKGHTFVASIEHKRFPFSGIQFHPEKASSVYSPKCTAKHTGDAIAL